MWNQLTQVDPIWISLGPLLFINAFALLTVVVFAFIRKRNPPIPGLEDLDKKHHSKFLSKWLKEYWFWVTAPVEKIALKLGLTPNFFTTLGFVLSVLSGLAFCYGRFGIGGWLMIIGGTCDMFDGRIARKTGRSSASGAFFDSMMDRYGELVCSLGLAAFYRNSWVFWFVLAGMIGSTMVSYNRARGQAVGVDCDGGMMQRPERIVYLGVGSIFSPPLAYLIRPLWNVNLDFLLVMAILLIAIMTNLTAIYRGVWIYRKLDQKPAKEEKKKEKTNPTLLLRETRL
jgi:phosphatidylglycerophosphate synthase